MHKKVRREVKFQGIKNVKYENSLYLALNSSWTSCLKMDFSSKLEEVDSRVQLDPVYKNYSMNIDINFYPRVIIVDTSVIVIINSMHYLSNK